MKLPCPKCGVPCKLPSVDQRFSDQIQRHARYAPYTRLHFPIAHPTRTTVAEPDLKPEDLCWANWVLYYDGEDWVLEL